MLKNLFLKKNLDNVAIKCTAVKINNELKEIFKHPKTDDGTKNSLKGLIRIDKENDKYVAVDQVSEEEEQKGYLDVVFKDGKLWREQSLADIRERINNSL